MTMLVPQMLSRPDRRADHLRFAAPEGARLELGRAHEAVGPSRRMLAMWIAAVMRGSVIWITPSWSDLALNPPGIAPMLDPGRLIVVRPDRHDDILWAAEESLRAGAAPLVVADLHEPPGLTPVRRLHLAAQGSDTPPLALLLTPAGCAAGVETRWSLAPDGAGWHLVRLRDRTAPEADWRIGGAPTPRHPDAPASHTPPGERAVI